MTRINNRTHKFYPSQSASHRKPFARRSDAPLSFAQQRAWKINQGQGNFSADNDAMALRLIGPLDISAIERALRTVVNRHEILRTNYRWSDDRGLIQFVREDRLFNLPVIDMSKSPPCQSDAVIEHTIAVLRACRFELSRDLMLRAVLLRLNPTDHILLVVAHSIAIDQGSSEILWRELATLYNAYLRGKPNPLPELPIQYGDFAIWERDRFNNGVLSNQLTYWKRQLEGVSDLGLPSDRRRPSIQSHRGSAQSLLLPKVLTDQLHILSRQEGASLFMTLFAAFQSLLSRITGQVDFTVASPFAARNRSGTEKLIGLFENTVLLRSDLSGDMSFRELLARVRTTTLAAHKNQEWPFEQLVEELYRERDLRLTRLFPVIFVHQNAPRQFLEFHDLTVWPIEMRGVTTRADLNLNTVEESGELKTKWQYNTDLFEHSTIHRMMGHYQTLLEAIVANPDQRISELPLLSEEESHLLLVQWNRTRREFPEHKFAHRLFEEQVEKTPDAPAVLCPAKGSGNAEPVRLTYRELNSKANQLAHYLTKLGVGPEITVGIYMERSPEMIIALLAIHKAGGAYVPLDPNDPLQRLSIIAEEMKFPVILSQKRLAESFPGHLTKVICLETDWENIARESKENPVINATPDNLAYVMYVSSSTGKPKGVAVTHKSLTNFICWAASEYEVKSSDRVLQFASIRFGTAIEEILPCLTSGAQLVLDTDLMLDSLSGFLQYCRDWHITILVLPTGFWHELVEDMPSTSPTDFGSLRLVIIGGEQASASHLTRWQKVVGDGLRLVNTYGHSEATVVTTLWDCSNAFKVGRSSSEVAIGRPIANTEVYILDDHLSPVPVGVRGEIYIGGTSLARGYFKSPELTVNNFIAHPFSSDPGARLFKTGDMARYRADGNIEFLGCAENRAKIRGFRVELGEIERMLVQHPSVRNAVVLARDDTSGRRRLVAYLTSNQGAGPTSGELASFLRATLPEYMVPSAFVYVNHFPTTPNGRVDRQALAALSQDNRELRDSFVAPRTANEKMIAAIWAEILNLKQIGVYDDFFDVGNHSTLAIDVVTRVRRAFAVDLSLQELFEEPTVAGMAAAVAQRQIKWSSERNAEKLSPQSAYLPGNGGHKPLYGN